MQNILTSRTLMQDKQVIDCSRLPFSSIRLFVFLGDTLHDLIIPPPHLMEIYLFEVINVEKLETICKGLVAVCTRTVFVVLWIFFHHFLFSFIFYEKIVENSCEKLRTTKAHFLLVRLLHRISSYIVVLRSPKFLNSEVVTFFTVNQCELI